MGRTGRSRRGATLLALALLVAACTQAGEPTASTTTAAPEGPLDGGSLRLGLPGPVVADPLLANPGSPADMMVLDILHDGLTALDEDGTPGPALARRWQRDETGTRWTFELDPDATFTSGEPVTVGDVSRSLSRLAAAGSQSLAGVRLEAIAGYDAVAAGEAEILTGIREVDGSLEIELTRPLASLPALLAAPPLGIVDVDGLEGSTSLADLDLTGDWAVVDAGAAAAVLRGRDDRDAARHLDELVLVPHEDAAAAHDAREAGAVDWALVPAGVDGAGATGTLLDAPFHAEVFLGLRVDTAPLDRREVREAIAAAIDRDAVAEEVYDGFAVPLPSVVPAGVPGHDPGRCRGVACTHDPEAARAHLRAATGDEALAPIGIDVDDTPLQVALGELLVDQLEAAGIASELRVHGTEEYVALLTSGSPQVFSLGWVGVQASPEAYLEPLFRSASLDNLTRLRSEPIDELLGAAATAEDPAAAWADIESRVLGSAVVVPLVQFEIRAIVGERVRGLEHRVDGSVDWSGVWVTDAAA